MARPGPGRARQRHQRAAAPRDRHLPSAPNPRRPLGNRLSAPARDAVCPNSSSSSPEPTKTACSAPFGAELEEFRARTRMRPTVRSRRRPRGRRPRWAVAECPNSSSPARHPAGSPGFSCSGGGLEELGTRVEEFGTRVEPGGAERADVRRGRTDSRGRCRTRSRRSRPAADRRRHRARGNATPEPRPGRSGAVPRCRAARRPP